MKTLALILALLLLPVTVAAQAPSTLPLVQAGDVVPIGTINVPPDGFDNTGGVIAFNPARNSLFMQGWAGNGYAVGEFGIPASGSGTLSVLQPLRDIWDGRRSDVGAPDTRIGGLMVWQGRLCSNVFVYYDADYVQRRSHFCRPLDLSAPGQSVGPTQIGTQHNEGYYDGWMAPVPTEWQALIGATHVTGNGARSILSRTSYGPALFPFNPATKTVVGQLLWYDGGHALPHPLFNGTTWITSVVWKPGTRAILFFGRTGIGPVCYGSGASCGEPNNQNSGYHAPPYVNMVWAYDANDLVAVKNGTREPWSVRPYATWQTSYNVGGADIDPATGKLYVLSPQAVNGMSPLLRVFQINAGTTAPQTPPVVTPPVVVPPVEPPPVVVPPVVVPPPTQGATYRTDIEVKTCGLTVTADHTPDGTAGWRVQFQRNGASHGTRVTGPAPYTRTATVNAGSYVLTAVWTKGATTVTDTIATRVCPD